MVNGADGWLRLGVFFDVFLFLVVFHRETVLKMLMDERQEGSLMLRDIVE